VNGLTTDQWIYSFVISVFTLLINLILKFVPDSMAPTLGDEDPEEIEEAKRDYINLRKTREKSSSIRQGNFVKNKEGSAFKN